MDRKLTLMEGNMGNLSRRAILCGASSLLVSRIASPGHGQEQALKIVYPFVAGGSGDSVARVLAERMQASLGRSVIVDNRSGAGGRIGLITVKQTPPDGNTLLFAAGAQIFLQPHLDSNRAYDPFSDFLPISQVIKFDQALAIAPSTQAKSLRELVTWFRANPDHAVYGSPGAGTVAQFAASEFARLSKLELRHAAYRGTPAALPDLLAGRIPMYIASTAELIEQYRASSIGILATTDAERSPFLPDIPTFRESGFDILTPAWWAIYAPAGTPRDVAARLNRVIVSIVHAPDVRARILALGFQPTGTTAQELMAIQRADYDRWGGIVKASGFQPEP
jgi:tripartite-type tricarboxylate transporter receptor subunit TctC